jgi:hypothetical protein
MADRNGEPLIGAFSSCPGKCGEVFCRRIEKMVGGGHDIPSIPAKAFE